MIQQAYNNDILNSNLSNWISLGTYTGGNSWNIDISTLLPDNYTELTSNNFVVEITKTSMALGSVSYSDGNATTLTKTYTPSTGLLTVRFCRGFSGGFVNGTEFNLYFIG